MSWVLGSGLAIALLPAAQAAEVCGNLIDDDGNGMADEQCYPSMATVCESPLSCSDTGWVSWSTGSIHYDLPPDVAPRSPYGHDIPFRRFYTSLYAPGTLPESVNRTPLGPRWQHNYMSWLRLQDDGMSAVLHTTDGRDVVFTSTGTTGAWNWFAPQAGQRFQYLRQRGDKILWELRTLDGNTLVYDYYGRLVEVWDTVADPNTNKVRITWTATVGGNVDTVTDATGARRLKLGYTGDLLTSIDFQLRYGTTWTTQHTTTYDYADGLLSSVTIGGQLAQTNVYTNGNLTQIKDGDEHQIVAFAHAAAAPGRITQVDTEQGTVGLELESSRAECSGGTVVYFNKGNGKSCSSDGDCGSGLLCGGTTGPGATGMCFRAARCLTLDATGGESLVTGVRALGPPSEQCTGACAAVTAYVWNPQTLDLLGTRDALGSFTSVKYDGNGMPVKIAYADTDADATSGGQRVVYLFYDPTYPGRLREVRRPSVMVQGSCSETSTGGCARTLYEYDYNVGKLARVTETGYSIDEQNDTVEYSYATTRTYDDRGRLTSIDGPLTNVYADGGDYDVSTFAYWTSADPAMDGFLFISTTYASAWSSLSQWPVGYDFWGNPKGWLGLDNRLTCLRHDPARNYLAASSKASAAYADCDVDDPNNLTERYTRDSALRLTKVAHADGSCTHYEYDDRGRLARVKQRDDCNPASPGDREEYLYDADGLLTEVDTYDQAGVVRHKQLTSYHDSRRPARIMNPADPTKYKAFTYDERGVTTRIDDEAGLGRTTYGVDADYRLASVSRSKTTSASDTWTLVRNTFGKIISLIDPDSKALQTQYDDAGRLVRKVSPDQTTMHTSNTYTPTRRLSTSTSLAQTKRFTYDSMGRLTSADYPGRCNTSSGPEIQNVYDRLPAGMACPLAGGCNYPGKLVYSKVSLLCNTSQYADGSLDQETFYAYDFAGRVVEEYVRDDSLRVADHRYAWDKNGNLTQVTLPSSTVLGATYGSAASNSDADRPTALWRTSPATPIIDSIQWNPGGLLKQYNRYDAIAGIRLRMKLDYDLAYRPTLLKLDSQQGGGPYYYLQLARDAKGRVIKRDYYPSDPQLPGVFDSYFLYDNEDRLLCETTSYVTSCPASGGSIKNHLKDGYTGAGDRKTLLRPIAGSDGGLTHLFNLAPGSHRLASVDQIDGAPALGTTSYTYNAQGNRIADDNTDPSTHMDARSFSYDARGNLVQVQGSVFDPYTGAAETYVVRSAFDAKNRRVFKSYWTPNAEAQWFFYYDALDRLAEVRYTPNISTPATYTTYQLVWLDDLLVAYWQTDQPTGATSKRYVEFDETGRPVRMHNWLPGNSTVAWAINPDAWGDDRAVIGADVFQPIVFAGQYRDAETAAFLDDMVTVQRPGLVLNGHRTYDPFTGGYLQLDPLVKDTWSPYAYADNDPVGASDPTGLATAECISWSCGAKGDGDVIEVSCTCTARKEEAARFEPLRSDSTTRNYDPEHNHRAQGIFSGVRRPKPPAREKLWKWAHPEGEGASSPWEDQCWTDIQDALQPDWEDIILKPNTGRGSGFTNLGRSSQPFELGPAAQWLPGDGNMAGYDMADGKEFCRLLRKTLQNARDMKY